MSLQSRESAWSLLTEYTQSESLRKHAMAVEACMRAYAQKFARDNGFNPSEASELEHKYSITACFTTSTMSAFPVRNNIRSSATSSSKSVGMRKTCAAPSFRMPITAACHDRRIWKKFSSPVTNSPDLSLLPP